MFSPSNGSVVCTACVAGTRSDSLRGSAGCTACGAGEFSVGRSAVCASLGVVAADGKGTCALQPGGLRLCWPPSPGPFDDQSYVSMCRDCGVVTGTGALVCVGGTVTGTFLYVTCDSVAGVACAVTVNGGAVVCFVPTTLAPLPSGPHVLPAAAAYVTCAGVLGPACCALLSDATVSCWTVWAGGLALGPPSAVPPLAALVVGASDEACGAPAGGGDAVCWRLNTSTLSTPPPMAFTKLCTYSGFWCGISGGVVRCWGAGEVEDAPNVANPPAMDLACGPTHVCALDSAGLLDCAGVVPERPSCPSPSSVMAPNRCVVVVAVAADNGRGPGIGPGDTVTLLWSRPFTLPVCNPEWRSVGSALGGPFVFSPPLGALGARGGWVDGRTFVLTLERATGNASMSVDLAQTRVGNVAISLLSSPCAEHVNVTSDGVMIRGTWGAMPAPRVLSAIAVDSGAGRGLNEGDSVVVSFDAPTNRPKMLDARVGGMWSWAGAPAALGDVELTGDWRDASTLVVSLSGPSLVGLDAPIGEIGVNVSVLSADESSPPSEQVVPVIGTFGNSIVDVRGPSALSLRGGEQVTLSLAVHVGGSLVGAPIQGFYGDETREYAAAGCVVRSRNSVVCTTVPGVGANLAWRLVGAGADSVSEGGPETQSSYAAPVLLDLTVEGKSFTDTVGGGVLVLTGGGFGASTSDLDGVVCSTAAAPQESTAAKGCIVTVPNSVVQCIAPPLRGQSAACVLSVGGQHTGVAVSLGAAPPVITGVALVQWNATCGSNVTMCAQGGDVVLVSGNNFGAVVDGVLVACGASFAHSCRLAAPHTAVLCTTPPGGGSRLVWAVSVIGVTSAAFVALSYAPPQILSFSPLSEAHTAGFTARVTCANCQLQPVVVFDGARLPSVRGAAGSWLVDVPRGVGGGHSCVLVSGNQRSGTIAVSYAPPAIVALDIVSHSPPLYDVKITGTSLGGVLASTQVVVGAVACGVLSVSHTSVVFSTSTSAGLVVVTIAGLASPPVHFDALAPQAQPLVTGWHAGSLALDAGGTVTVQGAALRASLPGVTRVVLVPYDCGGAAGGMRDACVALTIAGDGRALECALPPSTSATVVLAVVKLVRGSCGAAAPPLVVRYDPPVVAGTTPSALRTSGGDMLAIAGLNLEAGTTVAVGGAPCTVVSLAPRELLCTAPAGGGAAVPLLMTSPTYGAHVAGTLRYARPVVLSMAPAVFPAVGGTLTLSGTDLGDGAITRVLLDGVAAAVRSAAWNFTSVLVPAGVGAGLNVTIDVAGQVIVAGRVGYTPPAVAALREAALDAAAGGVFHVLGANFGPPPGARVAVTVNLVPCTGVTVGDDGELSAVLPPFQAVAYAAALVVTVAGQASRPAAVPVLCPPGQAGAAGLLCTRCPPNAVCYGGRLSPVPAFGYYAAQTAAGRTYVPCQPAESCVALPAPTVSEAASGAVASWLAWPRDGNETVNCAAPAYGGAGCAVCGQGFYRKEGACTMCSPLAGLHLALFVAGAAAGVLLLTWAYQRRAQLKGLSVGIDFAQVCVPARAGVRACRGRACFVLQIHVM